MKILITLLVATIILSCNTTTTKPQTSAPSSLAASDTSTIDKSKFDSKWVDDITEMADTDDWVVLSDDEHFTLVQVLTSRTNRHYILYSKDAQFDINGLAWMKIKAPSCLDIHTYNCDVDKLNFSIRDSYPTDFAFEKLHDFLDDKLLKLPEPISAKHQAATDTEMLLDEIKMKYDEMEWHIDSLSVTNGDFDKLNADMSTLKQDIKRILNNKNTSTSDLNKVKEMLTELDKKVKAFEKSYG